MNKEVKHTIKRVSFDDIYLYVDDVDSIYILDKKETIHTLDSELVESYQIADFDEETAQEVELLLQLYYTKTYSNQIVTRMIVKLLRQECMYSHRLMHYSMQLSSLALC